MCRVAQRQFNASATAVPSTRHWLIELLRRWEADDLVDTAELLTSELVTNAVRHSEGAPTVLVAMAGGWLEVAVSDDEPGYSHSVLTVGNPNGQSDRTGGRGLFIVDTCSSDWGVTRKPDLKHVWFRLDADSWPYRSSCTCPSETDELAALPSGRHVVPVHGPWG